MKRIVFALIALLSFQTFATLSASEPLKKIIVRIPTRAGDSLVADAWVTGESTRKPVIFIQTPYNKIAQDLRKGSPSEIARIYFDTANYHYVIMDWRGLYSNASVAKPGYDLGLDGYDAIEWIAAQSWCDGKVGTYGSSALGLIQFQTLAQNPPHLACAAPFVIDYKNEYGDFYDDGSYREEYVKTISSLGFTTEEMVLSHPKYDFFWKLVENQTDIAGKIKVPLLLMTGWYDHFPSSVIRVYSDVLERSAVTVKDQHKLVIGPWTHTGIGLEKQGEFNFPEAMEMPFAKVRQFFGHYLLGEDNNWVASPNITYFQMGENNWKTIDAWTTPGSDPDTLFAAYPNGLVAERWEIPDIVEQKQSYVYDPRNPSPTVGGSRFSRLPAQNPPGPMDISQKVESRNDCVILTTAPFAESYSIRGKATVKLSIESDKTDTDFGVRLTDVLPDGKSIILTQGMQRARFRKSLESETFLSPGVPDSVEIELPDLAYTFLPGHSLRIVVASSNYPMYSLNPNDGGTLYQAADTTIANNAIRFGKSEPSYVILPVAQPSHARETRSSRLRLFPNPASDFVNIAGRAVEGFEIYDLYGKKVKCEIIESPGGAIVDISGLPVGIYLVGINGETVKLIKL